MTTLVQQYFTAAAEAFPGKGAIHCGDRSSTYRETELRTNAIANHLRRLEIRRGSFVPFFMSKSVESIHSILAILKADCAYVPVDVNSPGPRIQSILETCEAPVIIVDSASRERLENAVPDGLRPPVFVIDEFDGGDESAPDCENLSIDIAYVIFTSGSTGVPKGVMIPHKAIVDYIDWCVRQYGLTSSDVISNHAPLYFDNSTFDIYTAFKTGAELHLVDDDVNAVIPSLISWLDHRNISVFFCVPSVLSLLLRSRRLRDNNFSALRHVICAGEVLPPDVLRSWMQKYPHIQYTNMYGPTEITVDCSFHVVPGPPAADQRTIPIGKARPNMELFVRDEAGRLSQAIGAKGELLVRGTSVGYGYLGDPERTRSVFVQNPDNTLFADPLYCTGDLVAIDERGDYVFIGRVDDQIKYLGHRIELGEIEAALNAIDLVVEGVVVFNAAPDTADQAIGALVSLAGDAEPGQVREGLRLSLTPYMVPARIVTTDDDFPRTPNGKYDRKAIRRLVFDAAPG